MKRRAYEKLSLWNHTSEAPAPPLAIFPCAEAAIWPKEFQQDAQNIFRRQGKIVDWDKNPFEYLDGDFYSLKELNIGVDDPSKFVPTPALKALVECYKYWIAFADLDAFRSVHLWLNCWLVPCFREHDNFAPANTLLKDSGRA